MTVVNLAPGTYYKFKVESRNAYGYSVYSNEVTILAAQTPDAPTDVLNNKPVTD